MNLKNVCRTCLRVPKQPQNLNDNLIKKIEVIASIMIEDSTELPKQICQDCFNNINVFYNFRKVIRNTDIDLRMRLDTLIRTNYTQKPRSKMKIEEYDMHTTASNSIIDNIGTDSPLPQNDNDSEEDWSTLRALAMKKIFRCNHCKRKFNSRQSLHNHRKNTHAAPGVCNICGVVVRADNLSKHIKLHSDNPCKCDQCGKELKNSESLRTHKFTHSKNSYTCEICGKIFKVKAEHTRHLKKHNDPDFRKSTCNLCGKKVNEIKKHMLSHTGEKPYICQYCNKGFASRYALKIHSRQHTNEKPFKCRYCDYAFHQKVSLLTHVKSKHCDEFSVIE